MVKDVWRYLEVMMSQDMWAGAPEWKMISEFLGHPVIVFSPTHGCSWAEFYRDVYVPKGRHLGPPLLIKSLPGHFQVICI